METAATEWTNPVTTKFSSGQSVLVRWPEYVDHVYKGKIIGLDRNDLYMVIGTFSGNAFSLLVPGKNISANGLEWAKERVKE